MKGFVNRIYQYEEVLFSDTGNVERDGLYAIDPDYDVKKGEEFGGPGSPDAKSSPSKLTKQSSPSPTKSMQSRKAKSPGKAPKLQDCTTPPESTTFAKFEQQSRLVTLLIENHKKEHEEASPANRCGETPETEAELVEPYLKHGLLSFPSFILTISREDMQRLVCKCAGVGQDPTSSFTI